MGALNRDFKEIFAAARVEGEEPPLPPLGPQGTYVSDTLLMLLAEKKSFLKRTPFSKKK